MGLHLEGATYNLRPLIFCQLDSVLSSDSATVLSASAATTCKRQKRDSASWLDGASILCTGFCMAGNSNTWSVPGSERTGAGGVGRMQAIGQTLASLCKKTDRELK